MKTFVWAAVLGLLAAIITGCPGEERVTRAGEPVPVFQEFRGQQGPFADRGFFVVQRPDTWQALWAGRPAPNVDFTRNTALVALLGQQPTGGYDINITDVRATGTQVVAYVDETRPRPGEAVTQVITSPYHIVIVPKLAQPVAFSVEGAEMQPIAVQELFLGQQSLAVNPATQVIRDANTWAAFWTNTFGAASPVPAIDFNRYMVAAVLLGRRPTAGYNVVITGVQSTDSRLDVRYRATAPAPGQVVAQVITSPFAIAVLPATSQAVAFVPVTTPIIAATPATGTAGTTTDVTGTPISATNTTTATATPAVDTPAEEKPAIDKPAGAPAAQ